jgi:hypothetical protein
MGSTSESFNEPQYVNDKPSYVDANNYDGTTAIMGSTSKSINVAQYVDDKPSYVDAYPRATNNANEYPITINTCNDIQSPRHGP